MYLLADADADLESLFTMSSWWKVLLIFLLDFAQVQPQTNPNCQECIVVLPTEGEDAKLVGDYRYVLRRVTLFSILLCWPFSWPYI